MGKTPIIGVMLIIGRMGYALLSMILDQERHGHEQGTAGVYNP
jgi:hypothetical protein